MSVLDTSIAPGYLIAFAYWIGEVPYIFRMPLRYGRFKTGVLTGIFLVLMEIFPVLTRNGAVIWFYPCLAVTLSLMICMCRLTCRAGMASILGLLIHAYVMGEFIVSLGWLCYWYAAGKNPGLEKTGWAVLITGTIIIAVRLVTALCTKWLQGGEYRAVLTLREAGVEFIIAITVYALSNISNLYADTPFSSSFTKEIILIRMLFDLCGVVILTVYDGQCRSVAARLEIQMLQQTIEVQYTNYKILKESMDLVNRKYHDMKHHISVLRSDYDQTEKKEYLDQLEREIQSLDTQIETGNKILNTIVAAKLLQCQHQGITMTCVADASSIRNMSSIDISALFGNALDNAIEGAMETEKAEKRFVHMEMCTRREFVLIRIINSCREDIAFAEGLPQTDKQDASMHGFGTKSIRSIAQKYEGSAIFSVENGCFQMSVIIPKQNI